MGQHVADQRKWGSLNTRERMCCILSSHRLVFSAMTVAWLDWGRLGLWAELALSSRCLVKTIALIKIVN
jgi:hypothetical protein